jgi:hypothetical protein
MRHSLDKIFNYFGTVLKGSNRAAGSTPKKKSETPTTKAIQDAAGVRF